MRERGERREEEGREGMGGREGEGITDGLDVWKRSNHHTVFGGKACVVRLSQPLHQACVFTTSTAPDLIPSPLNPCSLRKTSQYIAPGDEGRRGDEGRCGNEGRYGDEGRP